MSEIDSGEDEWNTKPAKLHRKLYAQKQTNEKHFSSS